MTSLLVLFEGYRLLLRALVLLMAVHFFASTFGYLRRRSQSAPAPAEIAAAEGHRPAADPQRILCGIPCDRGGLPVRLPARAARDPGSRRFGRWYVRVACRAVARLEVDGFDIVHIRRAEPSGFKAAPCRRGSQRARGEFVAMFDADFVPAPDVSETGPAALRSRAGRDGAGGLGAREPGAELAHAPSGTTDRRAVRGRADRQEPRRAAVSVQWHCRGLAAGGDRRCGRLDFRFADRRSRSEHSRPACGLAPGSPSGPVGALRAADFAGDVPRSAAALGAGTAQLLRKRLVQILTAPLPLRSRMAIVTQLGRHLVHPLVVLLVLTVPLTTFYGVPTLFDYGWANAAILGCSRPASRSSTRSRPARSGAARSGRRCSRR